jgi:hypothetical protein
MKNEPNDPADVSVLGVLVLSGAIFMAILLFFS